MQMLELFQTEWCPASRRVRQRLTELGLDYINRQVPVEREARTALREAVGTDTIPALRLENGSSIVGEENILVYLSEHFAEGREAEAHQQKAAKARRRYLGTRGRTRPRRALALQRRRLPARRRHTHISAVDAERMLSIVDNEQLAPIAADVKRRLGAVVARAADQRTGGQR